MFCGLSRFYIIPSTGVWPTKGEPCLGYSFGIDYEWKFDEGLEALGCQGKLIRYHEMSANLS